MGRIVIGPDHGGATETIIDGQTGFLFKHGNADDLAAKLDAALNLSADERRKMAQNAVDSVRREFSKSLMCSKTLNLYQEILKTHPVKKNDTV